MRFLASAFLASLIGLATGAPVQKRWPSGSILTPQGGYIYHQSTTHPPPDYIPKIQGLIKWQSSTSEVHIFNLPVDWVGKTVEVHFWYNAPNKGGVPGDIVGSARLPPSDGIGSNNRDKHLGRFYVPSGGGDAATKAGDGPTAWKSYQLPAGADSVAFEAAGVSYWDGSKVTGTDLVYELATSGVYLKRID